MIAFGSTDKGISRVMNQDNYFVTTENIGNLPNLFIVADGMGGHKAGDVASKTAVNIIINEIRATDTYDPVSIMEHAIEMANEDLINKSRTNPEYEGMGTTLVMATVVGEMIYIANIGDSRLYVVGDEIRQITRDHSYVQELVSLGKLDKDSARNHRRKNVLTRALGVEDGVIADFFEVKKTDGEKLLICSDGLTNMVEDEDIRQVVKDAKDIKEAINKLIELANKNGGMDNITAVLVNL